jgi:CheY-like chemotaxis protein
MSAAALRGRRVLIVEDEYLIASELALELEKLGAEVIGPASSVREALRLVENEALDGAVLDINLRGERAYPIADALAARAVPFVFATGYDATSLPAAYEDLPRCEKPVNACTLAGMLARQVGR